MKVECKFVLAEVVMPGCRYTRSASTAAMCKEHRLYLIGEPFQYTPLTQIAPSSPALIGLLCHALVECRVSEQCWQGDRETAMLGSGGREG